MVPPPVSGTLADPSAAEESTMTYAFTARVPLPIEVYEASHAEILRSAGEAGADGLILHMARVLPDGFEVLEIWQSREQADRFNREVVGPALERIGVPADAPQPELTEFEPRVVMAVQVYDSETAEVSR
jgi:hypothetical protein